MRRRRPVYAAVIAAAIALAATLGAAQPAATTPPGSQVSPPRASPIEAADTRISPTPLSLTIHMHFRDKYVWNADWPVAREVARLTNISLVNAASKVATNSQQQFNLLMVSRKLPDIVGGDGLKDSFIRGGLEGAFVPLNPLIERHAPHIKAFLQDNPRIAQAITAPDGNIYYVPYVPDGTVTRGWWVRQDWLDKLKLKAPQTVDELYEVLKAFRDRDPNGNGKKDEVPYFDSNERGVYRLVLLWGARSSGSNTAMDFMVDNGRVVHPFTEERFRVGIRNVAKWYAEGLIDKEIFTRRARAREQLFGANLGGMTRDWFASTSTYNEPRSIPARVPGFKLAAIAPPADVNGQRFEEDSRKLVMPDGWAISHRNAHPVETIKLFDFYFSPPGRRLSNFGVEGVHHTLVDGKPQFMKSMLTSGKPINSQLWAVGAQIPIGFRQDYAYEAQWTFPSGLAGRELYMRGNYILPQFTGVNMTPRERAVYDRYWPELLTYMEEMAQNWVLGGKDVDQTWDAYQKRLVRLGYPKVIAAMQSAYDRQYGTAPAPTAPGTGQATPSAPAKAAASHP